MIFVTGGTGLIGSHLLWELSKTNKPIVALKRPTSNINRVMQLFKAYSPEGEQLFNAIQWVDGCIEDYPTVLQLLDNIKEVYHCAAIVSFHKKDASSMLETNVVGTSNLVDACLERGIDRFCYVSSVAALGSSKDGEPVSEATAWEKSKGQTGYAISKFRSEMEVWRGISLGLNAVMVNPTVVIGPGPWNSGSGQIIGTIAKGFPFYTTGITGYVDVRDVALAMVIAMEKALWGKRYVLNGENLSHQAVFNLLANALGKKPPYINVKPWLSSIAWRLAWVGELITRKPAAFTRETARSGHAKTYYTALLAEQELGIRFRSIKEAVENTVKVGEL